MTVGENKRTRNSTGTGTNEATSVLRRSGIAPLSRGCAVAALMLAGFPASSQELPSDDALRAMLTDELPAFWTVEDFAVVATSRLGDAISPQAAIRFEAEAAPTAPLYVLAGQEGPFDVVLPSAPVADPEADVSPAARTLYGVASMTYRAGTWAGDLLVENPVEELGQPLSAFGRPTLVLGSVEGESTLALLRERGVAAEVARQEAELDAMRAAHEQARAALEAEGAAQLASIRAAQAEETRAIERRQAADAARLEAEGGDALASRRAGIETDLAGLDAAFVAELAALAEENAPALETARAQAAERRAAVEAEGEVALAAARSEADAALEAARATHASERGALIETQEMELAQLGTRLDDRRAALEEQVTDATGVLALQERLTSDLAAIEANMTRLGEAGEAVVAARAVAVDALSGRWEGTASCGTPGLVSASAPSCPQTIADGEQALAAPLACSCTAVRPLGGNDERIWGTGVYSGGSNTCIAARHAGAIDPDVAGPQLVIVEPRSGQPSYASSSRGGVTSLAFNAWSVSFGFNTDPLTLSSALPASERPENVWSVAFTTEGPFGTGWRGTFANESEATPPSPATLSVSDQAETDGASITLALDEGTPLGGSRILDLTLGADGRLTGASRDGACASVELTRVVEAAE